MIDSQCFIGAYIEEQCHKSVYGSVAKEIKDISDYEEEDQSLFSLRVCSEVSTACRYHEVKYLHKYHHLFGQTCSDPFQRHKKPISKGLREIKLDHIFKAKHLLPDNLVPGKSLCSNCYSKIFVLGSKDSEDFTQGGDITFLSPAEHLGKVDAACSLLSLSPASKIRKLSYDKRQNAIKAKVGTVCDTLRKNLETSLDVIVEDENENPQTLCNEYNELIGKLKQKWDVALKEDKVKILSLLPSSWSRKKITSEFNVSDRLIKITRQLVKEQGILPELGKRRGHGISEDTVKQVADFYEDDEYSRICPGKKDCVSVKIDHLKVQMQKRLMLINLNELYVAFKEKYPSSKIGISKFCDLKPKWCILAGASGIHTVCVCVYHQNIKLMIAGAKLNADYKDLISKCVCDSKNYNCMMNKCAECPGKEAMLSMLEESEEYESLQDNITFKQWITTDRAEIITVIKPKGEFFESLAEKLQSLKVHHFISKAQSQFLKEKKISLSNTECIVLADFAENFSFIIQDEIQGYHWVKEQATVHPFVYYYIKDNKVNSQCICILSDYLEHNTVAVHTFQTHLIRHIMDVIPQVEKIIYFSDGAASQYKNKKNFINICHHKHDFGLDAEWNFFASSHGKSACDGVGGTTKRETTKASLQRTVNGQILTVEDMYQFCCDKIKGITYIHVKSLEVVCREMELQDRFNSCEPIVGTRGFHRYIPVSDSVMRCFLTSKSEEFEDFQVSKVVPLTLRKNDIVACVYDGQWWLGEVEDICFQNKDMFINFYHPAGPRTSFKKSSGDKVWVKLKNILRKLTPVEFSTATGRSYNISQKLCEEVSQLLNKWLTL